MSTNESRGQAARAAAGGLPLSVYIAVAVVFALIGFGAVYVTTGDPDNRKGGAVVSSAPAPSATPG